MTDSPRSRRIDTLARKALTYPPEERHIFLLSVCETAEMRAAIEERIETLQSEADRTTTDSARPDPDQTTTQPDPSTPDRTQTTPDAPASPDPTETQGPPPDDASDADRTQTQGASDPDPTDGPSSSSAATPQPFSSSPFARPTHVGPWRLVRMIGRGGMGAVYLAERDDGQFQQKAALKLIRHDLGTAAQQRFLSERQILAQLQHPNIAHLLDGGVMDDGRPYFAMEYVDGTPLDTYCNTRGLGVEERLRLFQQVCEAVQFAHRNLIVHRDLKPGNILVTDRGTGADTGTSTTMSTTSGTGPQVKLLDFGIAKALEGAEAGAGGLTRTDEGGPMTPSYAAPEQVEGDPVTTATDVYALGVVLCELLIGALPYDVRGRSMVEAAQIIVNEKPKRLSQQVVTRLSDDTASSYDVSTDDLRRTLRGDMDVIVEKALRKAPEQRYTSAAELGQDLGRYLEGLPVVARPATTGYRIRRFVARNRTAVLGAVGALLALIVGLGVAVWQGQVAAAQRDRAEQALQNAAEERDRAQQQAARAEAVQTFLVDMIGRAAPATTGGEALTIREVLDEAEAELNAPAMRQQPEVSMDVRTTLGRMYRVLGRGEDAVRQGRRAYQMGLQHLGATDSLTLQTGSQYGISLLRTGQFQQADSLYGVLVPRLQSMDAPPSLRFVLLSHYGEVLRHQQRLDSAEVTLQTALRAYDRMSTPDTTLWTTALSNLGGVYRRQQRFDAAEEAYRRALSIAEQRAYEERAPSIAILANNLGTLHTNRGEPEQAEPLLRRSLRLMIDLFGETSGNVAATLTNLSRVLHVQDKIAAADTLSARAVAVHREVFPPSDYRIGFALAARVSVLMTQERSADARAAAEEALRLFQNTLGPQHPNTISMRQTVAQAARQQGDLQAAAVQQAAVLKAYRATRDSTDAALATAQVQLGDIRTAQGRYDDAEQLLLDAHRVQHGDSLTALHRQIHEGLAALYDVWNRPEKAERWRNATE